MKVPILLPKIFNFPLTYNSGSVKNLHQGDLVIVPFGKTEAIGVVWDKIHPTNKIIKLRNIKKKFINFSINKSLIKFINLFSTYNLVSKGMVLKMSLINDKNFQKFYKDENFTKEYFDKKLFILNNEQKKSLNDLRKFGKNFNVSVLQGTTGSGKTLVYFERIKEIINKGKQSLVLLPEIFLTNQFKDRFIDFFGFEPEVWHSKITPKNKRKIWQGIINNKIKLVIGARSSLMLPFKNLGIIIVDEEHDSSYKQNEGLIYNARDMAIARASFEDIPIHLITSVPSLETFSNIRDKKYNVTKIINRFKDFPLPETKIINLNLSKPNKNNFIAEETFNSVNEYLKKKEQILFFLNRRGYAPFLICKQCGFKYFCPHCSIYLTYHKSSEKLICHHCGYKTTKQKKCDDKKKEFCDFKMYGPGVEKVYDELKNKYPDKIIKIFSSDFLKKKKQTEILLSQIEKNEIDILVGTQMISKGFNFPKLNCIVVVDADFSGKGYDLRTTEKNIQLYNQLSGRAGRFSKKSLIVYQTISPSNKALSDVLKNNPEKFLLDELTIRKKNKLPPFNKLVALIISSNSASDSFRGAQEIKRKLTNINDAEILGPVDSPIFRVNKKYRTRLLIKSKNNKLIQKKLASILEKLNISKKIKLMVDVDPLNFT